jgi:hypothetical protein
LLAGAEEALPVEWLAEHPVELEREKVGPFIRAERVGKY